MGYGDAIMASGWARGFYQQGKLAAFYDPRESGTKKIKWSGYCEDIFKHNPNIARPGCIDHNLVWFPHYKKFHPYIKFSSAGVFTWNYDFKIKTGEFFFSSQDMSIQLPERFVFIEPNLAWQRLVSRNKDWGDGKYEKLADALIDRGYDVVQCLHDNTRRKIERAHQIQTTTFRQAAAIMSRANLVIASEGANHHAAAAVGVKAIIVWGGFSPTETMGYKGQIMLTGGVKPCGSKYDCKHCRQAMDNISVDEVYEAAIRELNNGRSSCSRP